MTLRRTYAHKLSQKRWENKLLKREVEEAELRSRLENLKSGSGGSGGSGGGSMSPQELLNAYQDGVAASGAGGSGNARSLKELRAINDMDVERMREEQNLQLQGQKEVLDQTRQARAAEKEQDFQYETRRRQREAGNAMAAYRNL